MVDTAKVILVLRKAAEIGEKPGAWCQATLARDEQKRLVSVHDEKARSWCAAGLLEKASVVLGEPFTVYHRAMLSMRDEEGVIILSLSSWNDLPFRTQAQVVAALRVTADQLERTLRVE